MRVAGKVALVTGASRGIGREVARSLGRGGASLVLVARNGEALEALRAEIGESRSLAVAADLSDPTQLRAAFSAAVEHFGRIDVLINNAAAVAGRDFLDTSASELSAIVDTNFRAAVLLTRLAAERMAAQGSGHIVNVASLAGVTSVPGEAVYAGTKAALRLFTASLRPELEPHGITLTDVVLGFVTTDLLARAGAHPRTGPIFDRARRLHMMNDTPAARAGAEIVRAIERQQDVLVIPPWSRYLYLALPGLSRKVMRLLS